VLIERLRLYQYRNLSDGEVNFSPAVNVILGNNGQGKSNLLESVSYLCFGKSFRFSDPKEVPRLGENEASIFCTMQSRLSDDEYLERHLGIVFRKQGRELSVDGKREKLSSLIGLLVAVTFSPTDISIVKGAPSERRRFLDRQLLMLKPAVLPILSRYNTALQQRNKLLSTRSCVASELEPWNEILISEGLRLVSERVQLCALLERAVESTYPSVSTQDGELRIGLRSSWVHEGELLTAAAAHELFQRNLQRELYLGSTLLGPHRDELVISLGTKLTRSFASQGQSRCVLLALTMAMIDLLREQHKQAPIVLLDDMDAELDNERSGALFELVLKRPCQAFITSTDLRGHAKDLPTDSACFSVTNGVIQEAKLAP
jgi:DNA replication and repair protein RecF